MSFMPSGQDCSGNGVNLTTLSNGIFNVSILSPGYHPVISDRDARILIQVVNCSAGIIISFCGMIANLVNLCVFIKQGFSDTINVSFTSLAIADFFALLTVLGRNILYVPEIEDSGLPIDPLTFSYLSTGWPHVYFLRVGCWITALISFKRCLCIVIPLKVKTFFSTRKVVFIHCVMYFIVLATIAPLYYTNRFSWNFYPEKNRTLLGLSFSDDREEIEGVLFLITTYGVIIGGLIVNTICTVILVVKLNYHGKWRQNQASGGNAKIGQSANAKENRVIKMTVTISTIYILCFLPHLILLYYMSLNPDFRQEGDSKNSFDVLTAFVTLVEAFNSSVNIFIYYTMSSKFKSTMIEVFKLDRCLGKGERVT